jgi:hypothetical protein
MRPTLPTLHDYESLSRIDFGRIRSELLESYSGTAIVAWHGRIERQLVNLLNDAEKTRNFTYADKVREFLKIWRGNEISGSINRETLETLKAASDVLSVDNWNLATYFSSLRDQLRVLIASEEQLPRDVDMNQNEPFAGTGAAGRGAPPMSPSFGPEEAPPGEEGAGGTPPPPPGTEGAKPGEEGAEGGPGGPGAPPEGEGEETPEEDLRSV